MGAWLLGVGINLVGSILINLGTNVMKLGHNKRAALPEPLTGSKKAVSKIREWQIGVALFSVGNVANFISFGYAAQSLLAAIGCVQFVSNVLFASFVLKEKVFAAVIIAISCIVGGCIVLVSFGSHSSSEYTYKDLLALYGKPAYVSYMAIGAAVVMAAYAGFWIGQRQVSAKGPRAAALWGAVLPLLYCLFSAIIGTQSVLFSKTLAVLLRATASGDNQLTKWFTWLVLPAFLFTAVFWVSRLNKGLKMFPAMVIVPMLQICWTLFSILSGMLYFQEYQEMGWLQASMFCLGVAIVFAGVFLLTKASTPAHPQSQPASPLVAGAKVSYLHSTQDGTDEVAAGSPGGDGCIRTAIDATPDIDGHGGLLAAPVPDTPGSQPSFFLTSAPSQPEPELHPPIEHSDEDNDGWEDDEQLLLSVGRQPSHSVLGGRAGSSSSFSLGRALAGLRLQQLWQGGEAGQGSSAAAGSGGGDGVRGVQVLPDSGLSLEQGAAEASARQRRQSNQRLRARVGSLSRAVAADFSLDETAAARLSLGLGDESMPGISLFAMPMADLYGSLKAAAVARRYGALPDHSQGGAHESAAFLQARPQRAEASLLGGSMQLSTFGSGGGASSSHTSLELDDGSLDPSAAAAIRGLNRSSSSREQQQQRQAERQLAVHAAAGAPRGINPLSNAIDMSPSAHAASSKAPFDGLSNILLEVKSNFKELTASIQTAGSNRSYARMQSKDEMFAIVEHDEHGTSGGQAPSSGSFDGSSQGTKGVQ
uniref:Magnesium transporter n=1 Tax=Tetradesmus obliquus TaxID=3088 RepID=A0A383W012_TETOB|eukprot:jgi/Sobl393_1/13432/SZX69976.1